MLFKKRLKIKKIFQINYFFLKKKADTKTKALVSTAFQDHISKQLELDSFVNLNFNKPISRYKVTKYEAKSKIDSGFKSNNKCIQKLFNIFVSRKSEQKKK